MQTEELLKRDPNGPQEDTKLCQRDTKQLQTATKLP